MATERILRWVRHCDGDGGRGGVIGLMEGG